MLSTKEKALLNGYYVQNMGMFMDIKCFLKTTQYVLRGEGILEGGEDVDITHI